MNEGSPRTSQDVLGVVERAFDEDGVANYGCFVEVFTMIRQRVTLLGMISIDEAEKARILEEMYDIATSLPDLHDDALAKKHAARLQELLKI